MKKFISVVIAVLLTVLPFSLGAFAVDTDKEIDLSAKQTIEFFDDGSYLITNFYEQGLEENGHYQPTSSQGIESVKDSTFYDSAHNIQWAVVLIGRFFYNGSTANCSMATVSHHIYSSKWKVTSQKPSRNGNTAYGDFVVKRYTLGIPVQTVNVNMSIKCSPSGIIT